MTKLLSIIISCHRLLWIFRSTNCEATTSSLELFQKNRIKPTIFMKPTCLHWSDRIVYISEIENVISHFAIELCSMRWVEGER